MRIDTFYVLDFDRCLGRTEKLQELLERVVQREGVVSLDMIKYAHDEVRKTGGSFDTAAYVRQLLKDRQLDVNQIWGKIEAAFLEQAKREDLLEPYAKELLDVLTDRGLSFGILTYGGFEWQSAKLKATGLSRVPHIITSYKEKGRTIASWQRTDGTFLIPQILMKDTLAWKIILIDDKPVSFVGIPAGVDGVCVAPRAPKEEIDALPPTVVVVTGLKQAIELLIKY